MLYVHELVDQMGLLETQSGPKPFGTYTRHENVGITRQR
jgi:hypothetical protein